MRTLKASTGDRMSRQCEAETSLAKTKEDGKEELKSMLSTPFRLEPRNLGCSPI
jgi:hypothetical protein